MTTFNIIGCVDTVEDLLSHFKLRPSDMFPAHTGETDINVEVEDEVADEFCEWAEKEGLKYEMV